MQRKQRKKKHIYVSKKLEEEKKGSRSMGLFKFVPCKF